MSAKPFTHFVRNTETDHFYLVTDRGHVYAFYVRGDHLEVKKPPKPPREPGDVEEPAVERPAEPEVRPPAEPETPVEPAVPGEPKKPGEEEEEDW